MAILTAEVSPFVAPNYDLFSPARTSDPRGVVIGAPLDGAQSYTPWIGLSTVRELALEHSARVGLVPVEDLNEQKYQKGRALAELEEARERIAALEAEKERIAGLAAEGYTVVKKVGRPAKKENT